VSSRTSTRRLTCSARAYALQALLFALGAGCTDASSTKPNTTPGPLEIAFVRYSDEPTSPDLYRMSADGQLSQRVAALPGEESLPAWSPDARRFAFVRRGPSSAYGTLWIMEADGMGVRQVVGDSLFDACCVSWSPDGSQLAFSGRNAKAYPSIGVIGADGSNFHWLPGTAIALLDAPSWSPDGRRIAFGADNPNIQLNDIRIADADGSNSKVVLTARMAVEPSWSPDGSQLAVSVQKLPGDSLRIAVVDTNGAGLRILSSGRADWRPTWSPDGRFILYEKWLGITGRLTYHIYKTPASGGPQVDLTPNEVSAQSPMWRRVEGSSN
jgi:Tol biopolymer transport system component